MATFRIGGRWYDNDPDNEPGSAGEIPIGTPAAPYVRSTERRQDVRNYFDIQPDVLTDQSAKLKQMFEALWYNDIGMPEFVPGIYYVEDTIAPDLGANRVKWFGFRGNGAVIQSQITDPVKDVLSVVCGAGAYCRYMLFDGLKIQGNPDGGGIGRERHGIKLLKASADGAIWNLKLRDVAVEGVGGRGYDLRGDIFEGGMDNCYGQDCGGSGLGIGNDAAGGIFSAFQIDGGSYSQNGKKFTGASLPFTYPHGADGIEIIDTSPTAAPRDIRLKGGYARHNKRAGVSFLNGFTGAEQWGVENNWEERLGAAWALGYGGFQGQNYFSLVQCTGASSGTTRQSCLVAAFIVSHSSIVGCRTEGFGDGADVELWSATGTADPRASLFVAGSDGARPATSSGVEVHDMDYPA